MFSELVERIAVIEEGVARVIAPAVTAAQAVDGDGDGFVHDGKPNMRPYNPATDLGPQAKKAKAPAKPKAAAKAAAKAPTPKNVGKAKAKKPKRKFAHERLDAPTDPTSSTAPEGWEKVGKQGGSNPGGLYRVNGEVVGAKVGDEFYVKKAKSPDHARTEVAANLLYELAGVPMPSVHQGNQDDIVASKIVGTPETTVSLKKAMKDPETLSKIREAMVVDAWLGNWDAVGLEHDNIVVVDGTPYRIDAGGALTYRAQGSPKGAAWGDKVVELETLRDPGMNPAAASVYGDATAEELIAGAEAVLRVHPDDIRDLVAEQGLPTELADRLVARRDYVGEWIAKNAGPDWKMPEPIRKGEAAEQLQLDDMPEAPSVDAPSDGIRSQALARLSDDKFKPIDTGDENITQEALKDEWEMTAPDGKVYVVSTKLGVSEEQGEGGRGYDVVVTVDNAGDNSGQQTAELVNLTGTDLADVRNKAREWAADRIDMIAETGSVWDDDAKWPTNAAGQTFEGGTVKYVDAGGAPEAPEVAPEVTPDSTPEPEVKAKPKKELPEGAAAVREAAKNAEGGKVQARVADNKMSTVGIAKGDVIEVAYKSDDKATVVATAKNGKQKTYQVQWARFDEVVPAPEGDAPDAPESDAPEPGTPQAPSGPGYFKQWDAYDDAAWKQQKADLEAAAFADPGNPEGWENVAKFHADSARAWPDDPEMRDKHLGQQATAKAAADALLGKKAPATAETETPDAPAVETPDEPNPYLEAAAEIEAKDVPESDLPQWGGQEWTSAFNAAYQVANDPNESVETRVAEGQTMLALYDAAMAGPNTPDDKKANFAKLREEWQGKLDALAAGDDWLAPKDAPETPPSVFDPEWEGAFEEIREAAKVTQRDWKDYREFVAAAHAELTGYMEAGDLDDDEIALLDALDLELEGADWQIEQLKPIGPPMWTSVAESGAIPEPKSAAWTEIRNQLNKGHVAAFNKGEAGIEERKAYALAGYNFGVATRDAYEALGQTHGASEWDGLIAKLGENLTSIGVDLPEPDAPEAPPTPGYQADSDAYAAGIAAFHELAGGVPHKFSGKSTTELLDALDAASNQRFKAEQLQLSPDAHSLGQEQMWGWEVDYWTAKMGEIQSALDAAEAAEQPSSTAYTKQWDQYGDSEWWSQKAALTDLTEMNPEDPDAWLQLAGFHEDSSKALGGDGIHDGKAAMAKQRAAILQAGDSPAEPTMKSGWDGDWSTWNDLHDELQGKVDAAIGVEDRIAAAEAQKLFQEDTAAKHLNDGDALGAQSWQNLADLNGENIAYWKNLLREQAKASEPAPDVGTAQPVPNSTEHMDKAEQLADAVTEAKEAGDSTQVIEALTDEINFYQASVEWSQKNGQINDAKLFASVRNALEDELIAWQDAAGNADTTDAPEDVPEPDVPDLSAEKVDPATNWPPDLPAVDGSKMAQFDEQAQGKWVDKATKVLNDIWADDDQKAKAHLKIAEVWKAKADAETNQALAADFLNLAVKNAYKAKALSGGTASSDGDLPEPTTISVTDALAADEAIAAALPEMAALDLNAALARSQLALLQDGPPLPLAQASRLGETSFKGLATDRQAAKVKLQILDQQIEDMKAAGKSPESIASVVDLRNRVAAVEASAEPVDPSVLVNPSMISKIAAHRILSIAITDLSKTGGNPKLDADLRRQRRDLTLSAAQVFQSRGDFANAEAARKMAFEDIDALGKYLDPTLPPWDPKKNWVPFKGLDKAPSYQWEPGQPVPAVSDKKNFTAYRQDLAARIKDDPKNPGLRTEQAEMFDQQAAATDDPDAKAGFLDRATKARAKADALTAAKAKAFEREQAKAEKLRAKAKKAQAAALKLAAKNDPWGPTTHAELPLYSQAMAAATDDPRGGAAFAYDGGAIEGLSMRLRRPKFAFADGEEPVDSTQLGFKVSLDTANSPEFRDFMDQGSTLPGGLQLQKEVDGVVERNATGYENPSGVTTVRDLALADGTRVQVRWHNADFHEYSSPYALVNQVQVLAEGQLTQEQMAELFDQMGVSSGYPSVATQTSYKARAIEKLFNPKGLSSKDGLKIARERYGITPKDVTLEVLDGRITPMLTEAAAAKIAREADTSWFSHSFHHSTSKWGAEEWADMIGGTGPDSHGTGLKSTVTRWTEGIGKDGMSSTEDVRTGGGDYAFTRQQGPGHTFSHGDTGVMIDAAKALRRLDWFAYANDEFGTQREFKGTDNLTNLASRSDSSRETMFRRGVPVEHWRQVVVPSARYDEIMAELKRRGITKINGRPIEEFILPTGGGSWTQGPPLPTVPVDPMSSVEGAPAVV